MKIFIRDGIFKPRTILYFKIFLIETKNYSPLLTNETIEEIYNKYKEEDNFLYLQYSLDLTQKVDLKVVEPKYKTNNTLEERKSHSEKIISKNKIPVIVERYPTSSIINKLYEKKCLILFSNLFSSWALLS